MISWFGDSSMVVHVAKTGSNGNSGFATQYPVNLAANAKLTIASALSVVPDGGTILIWPGIYNEQVDIKTAAKSITLMGTNKHKCIISWNTTSGSSPTVYGYTGCRFANLTVLQTGVGMGIDCNTQHNCVFEDVYISSNGIDGLYLPYADYAQIRHCYVFGPYDVIVIGKMGLIEDSILITDGCYSGTGQSRVIGSNGAVENNSIIIRNSILLSQPSFGKTGKGAPVYTCQRDLWGLQGFLSAILENCIVAVDAYKPSGANAGSSATGDAYAVDAVGALHANNCRFICKTDQNQSGTTAKAIGASESVLINCSIDCQGQAESSDFTSGTHYLQNVRYNSSQLAVGANIILSSIGDTSGRVDIGAIKDIDADALIKAVKLLKNKAVQDKLTGEIRYYDDDGVTAILTHTPQENESSFTRVPS